MMDKAVDILVLGLGPAGASAAANAAAGGWSVLAIDRKTEAGQPVQCAEFVPTMIGSAVKGLAASVVQSIQSMDTFVEDENADTMDNFPGQMIDRGRFDASLVDEAIRNGAKCLFGMNVTHISDDGVVTLSNDDILRAKVIIGADGPRSKVGQAIGQVNKELVETRQMTVDLLKPHKATDIFLSSDIPGGYGWLFPKGVLANLGLGMVPSHKANLKPVLESLHQRLMDEGRVGADIKGYSGGAIPVGGMLKCHGVLGKVKVFLAGDAAGLANPITGAGINAAIMSGQLAGDAADQWLRGDKEAAEDYEDELDALFGTSLRHAVKRRQDMMAHHARHHMLTTKQLRDSWIAYPEYWAH